nr:spidroin-2-like [Macaca fascicularis]
MAPEAAFHIVTGVVVVVVFQLLRVIGVIIVFLHLILLIVLRLVGLLGVAVLFLLLAVVVIVHHLGDGPQGHDGPGQVAAPASSPPVPPRPPPGGAGAAAEGWESRGGGGPAAAASSGYCCPCWASSAASWGPSQPGLRPICPGGYRGAASEDPRWVQTWAVAAVAGLRSGSRGLLGRPVHLPLRLEPRQEGEERGHVSCTAGEPGTQRRYAAALRKARECRVPGGSPERPHSAQRGAAGLRAPVARLRGACSSRNAPCQRPSETTASVWSPKPARPSPRISPSAAGRGRQGSPQVLLPSRPIGKLMLKEPERERKKKSRRGAARATEGTGQRQRRREISWGRQADKPPEFRELRSLELES